MQLHFYYSAYMFKWPDQGSLLHNHHLYPMMVCLLLNFTAAMADQESLPYPRPKIKQPLLFLPSS
jgi:hypothetical protein